MWVFEWMTDIFRQSRNVRSFNLKDGNWKGCKQQKCYSLSLRQILRCEIQDISTSILIGSKLSNIHWRILKYLNGDDTNKHIYIEARIYACYSFWNAEFFNEVGKLIMKLDLCAINYLDRVSDFNLCQHSFPGEIRFYQKWFFKGFPHKIPWFLI